MAKDQVIAINEAVHKLQLALLDGITDQKQLFAAGSMMSRSDYEDVVTERTIAKLCGYPLCRQLLPTEPSRRGRYRISLKEHKVYDLQEACKFCSSDCLISSRAFSGTLQEARCSVFDPVKLNEILGLFEDSGAKESVGVTDDLGLSKLTIHENAELKVGDMSFEEWMGPSNAIEGYVPLNKSTNKSRNRKQDSGATQNRHGKNEDSLFSEMDFTSTIITGDEYSVSKLPPQTKEASSAGKSEERKGKDPGQTSAPPRKKDSSSSAKSNKPKTKKNTGFSEVDFVSSIITSDEYSVSKPSPHSTQVPLDSQAREAKGQESPETVEQQSSLTGSSSAPRTKGLSERPKESQRKVKFVETVPDSCQDDGKIRKVEPCKGYPAQNACSSSETALRPSLRPSGSKKLNRSVTWADENAASDGHGNLCEFRDIEDREAGLDTLSSIDIEDDDKVSRLVSAEACARALSQAAEAVASGDSDASDAVCKAGIVLLPNPPQVDGEACKDDSEEETPESEPTLLKWPKKPGIPDSDLFDPDQSWFDDPPEGFSLTLSTFATMWNALFGWVSSSSLAYIYGKDETAHEEFLCVNGREYPRKIILGDGRSSEIKETVAGCLARSLPGLTTDLRLPIPISELEKGLASLLDTMSFTEAIPSFRMKQWQVMVHLFMDALSVSRLPLLTPNISSRNKVLEGAGIGSEEYEIMKDLLIPLSRVPQFSSRSGA